MNFKPLTIKDIARALQLSPSTVSKALHNSHEISAETRNAVIEFAAKHNYKPNTIAQSLKIGRSKSIGVIVCHIDNNFFSQVINGIESIAHEKDYNVIITQTHDCPRRELLNIQHLASGSVDGLIVSLSAGTNNISRLKELHQNGLPIVLFDRVTDDINTHKIIAANYQGAYEATMHLVQQGYKHIAHITSSPGFSNTIERVNGYKAALAEAGFIPDENLIKYCEHGGTIPEEVNDALTGLLQYSRKPDAIFIGADRLSHIIIQLLKRRNISIPSQIALVGFSNSVAAEIFDPPLSAVTQPALDMGKVATEMLIQLIESKKPVTKFEKIILPTELITRRSSMRPGKRAARVNKYQSQV